jgi:hypothetical protein
MSSRTLLFSQVIEQEGRRWVPFRRALSKEDQAELPRRWHDPVDIRPIPYRTAKWSGPVVGRTAGHVGARSLTANSQS